jgi:hypothetical protein
MADVVMDVGAQNGLYKTIPDISDLSVPYRLGKVVVKPQDYGPLLCLMASAHAVIDQLRLQNFTSYTLQW